MKKLFFLTFLFLTQFSFGQNWNNSGDVLNDNIEKEVYRLGPIGVGFEKWSTYSDASAERTSILGQGGIVGHYIFGKVGDLNESKWCGLGLGNPGGAGGVFPYGLAATDKGHLAFYNIIDQTGYRKDVIAGYGFASDDRNVDRFRIVHYNQSSLTSGKDILIANSRGAVGINAEPFAALSVDTRSSANGGVLKPESENDGFISKSIAIQGEQFFDATTGVKVSTASAMGNQANQSLALSAVPVEGMRAQIPAFDQVPTRSASIAVDFQAVVDRGSVTQPVGPAIPAPSQYGEIAWQDLTYLGKVNTDCDTRNSIKNFYISFRNGKSGTTAPGVIDPDFGNSFSKLNKLPVATFTPRGRVGIGTIDPICQNGTTPVFLTVTGGIAANSLFISSDMKFKKDIKTIENALDKIKALRGTTYTYDRENFPNRHFKEGMSYGFIAQEVEKVIPEMAAKSDDGYYAVEYVALIPVLTEAIKEQDQIITDQTTRLNQLETINEQLQTSHEQLKSEVAALRNDKASDAGYKIFQNVPNPTSGKTSIAYEINQPFNAASINVYDLTGKYVQGFDLKDSKGTISLSLDNLLPGMYIYDLLIDGDQKAVKKMTLINRL